MTFTVNLQQVSKTNPRLNYEQKCLAGNDSS